jgi:hypothetical protein
VEYRQKETDKMELKQSILLRRIKVWKAHFVTYISGGVDI